MHSLGKLCIFSSFLTQKKCFALCAQSNFYTKQFLFSIHTSCHKQDAVKSDNTSALVYKAPLKNRIRIVKFLSLSSSMAGFALFPSVIYDLCKVNLYMGVASGMIASCFLITPLMLHWITKRYVIELHYNKESKFFTAKTFNIISQIKEIKFKAEDVDVPDLPGMLSSFLVKGKPLFVDANMVEDPDAYSHMMGYDKPFDIAIKVNNQDENTKAT